MGVELRALISSGMRGIMAVADGVPDTVHGRYCGAVSRTARPECMRVGAGTVDIVASGVMAAVSAGMATREAEEGHCGHPDGAEDEGEDVEVQLTTHWYGTESIRREESPAQKKADPSFEIVSVSVDPLVSGYQLKCEH
jgi:hypothetical protein